jgi:hypothetical protein
MKETQTLRRAIDWKGAFWVASGVWYRHYVQDKGKFPNTMVEDLRVGGRPLVDTAKTKAGILPYLTLVAGIAVVLLANHLFKL